MHRYLKILHRKYASLPEQLQTCIPRNEKPTSQYQYSHCFRPNVDPEQTTLLLFPDFTSPNPNFVNSKNSKYSLYNRINSHLGYDIFKTKSLASEHINHLIQQLFYIEEISLHCPSIVENCVGCSGINVGEYAALVFTESISLEDTVNLLLLRGKFIQDLINENPNTSMLSIRTHPSTKLGEMISDAKKFAMQQGIENAFCSISSYLYPEAKLLSGHNKALEYIQNNFRNYNIRSCTCVPINYANNSVFLKPLVSAFQKELEKINIKPTIIPVYSSVTGHKHASPSHTKRLLCQQLIKPIRWEQVHHVMYERKQGMSFPHTYELGSNAVLGSLLKLNNAKAHTNFHLITDCL